VTGELSMHLRADGVTVVNAPRALDSRAAATMRKAFIALTNTNNVPWIVVDLGATESADLMGLGTLLGGSTRARARGGNLVLADADDRLAQQLREAGLLKILRLYASASEAVDALKVGEHE
jgi:anti-anti-sigma factor